MQNIVKKGGLSVILRVMLACVLVFALTSCSTANNAQPSQDQGLVGRYEAADGTWVIYWYLCGSNLESKFGCATQDLTEMLQVSLPKNVQVIIEAGGSNSWFNSINPEAREIYRVSSEGVELLESWERANMGDPSTLEVFLNYCNTNYPAQHRMLLFWDHGGGSLGGVCNDEQYGMDSLKLPELEQALAATSRTTDGLPLYDIVGFDACLMASIDTARVFSGYAHYMVGSQEIEPGDGWDYTGMMQALVKDTRMDGEAFGRAICDTYYASMDQYDEPLATLSLIDLEKLDPLLEAYEQLGDEALVSSSQNQEYLGAFARSAREAENYYNSPSTGYTNMMDLGCLVNLGELENLFPISGKKLLNALDACVVYQRIGSGHQRATGLSCFYNYEGALDTLELFVSLSANKGLNYFYDYTITGKLSDEALEYAKQASVTLIGQTVVPEEFDITALQVLEGYPLTSNYSQWTLNVGPELGSQLAAVYVTQAWVNIGGDGSELQGLYGLNARFPHDYENGVFTANFQNNWGALGELPIYMEPLGGDGTNDFYTAPVLINNSPYSLIVQQDVSTGTFTLLGAAPPIDKKVIIGGRELYQLQEGDKVEAIMYFLLPEGHIDAITGTRLIDMPLGEIIYDNNTVIHLRSTTGYTDYWVYFMIKFVMIDFAGNTYYSAPGYYQVIGDGETIMTINQPTS